MKVNDYMVMTECVERGINRGYCSFKYIDDTREQAELVKRAIYDAVMTEICQYFSFNEDK